ncbi:MAG: cation-translocating P-type ATPase [Candidatus Babeliales bacterium]|jgi:Ca2+-transporting ATPase
MKTTKSLSWETLSIQDICSHLGVDSEKGLSPLEVARRLNKYGANQLPTRKKIAGIQIFLNQFASLMVWVLIIALIISGFLGNWVDAATVGVIVMLNTIVGFIQEYSAERSLAALRKLTQPSSRVMRHGIVQVVPSAHVVPGDYVILEEGDVVPADGRIVQAHQLAIQEAALTGESVAVSKISEALPQPVAELGDKKNMAFMGTTVVRGRGHMIITATGLATELGIIAHILEDEPNDKTPLQIQLGVFERKLVMFFFGITGVMLIAGIVHGHEPVLMFLSAVSLAVAAIPEGLPAVITITLAAGVRRMVRRKALVRRLSAVETLGCATVICTDKTGTLTLNEMTVRHIWLNDQVIDVTGVGYAPQGTFEQEQQPISAQENPELMDILRAGVLCSNATIYPARSTWLVSGDPTEGALITVAGKAGIEQQELEQQYPRHAENPFSSDRKIMSVLCGDGVPLFIVKGAPDIILEKSTHIMTSKGPIVLSSEQRRHIVSVIDEWAGQALRVLAIASKNVVSQTSAHDVAENDLTFIGLFAMMDPPRPQVKRAIHLCKKAGIRPVIITGDHRQTALAVAREVGMQVKDQDVITGAELDQMSDEAFTQAITHISVYARTSASHKIRIVRALKARGDVVAMTGDGVNDAPAVKAADIGVAMGITGTEVTKEASDMVIVDDNFATIVNAVEEGRGIYDNIIKFVNYMLSSHVAEVLIVFISTLYGVTDAQGKAYIVLLPIQILWLNLVTDSLPAIALGLDPLGRGAMNKPPRQASEPIITKRFFGELIFVGLLMTAGTMTASIIGFKSGAPMGYSMTLTTMVFLELMRAHMVRRRYKTPFFSNPLFVSALALSFALQLMILYVPFFQQIFKMVPLGIREWEIIGVIVAVTWFVGLALQAMFAPRKRYLH